jgi:hypothetical protein
MIKLSWYDFKSICNSKKMLMQLEAETESYRLAAFDGPLKYTTSILKQSPASSDQLDYENNYASSVNLRIDKIDAETGGITISPKWAPEGWHQCYHEIEWETSKLNSVHDKSYNNIDNGYTVLKFYDINNNELTAQQNLDTDCVLTQIDFMPTFDYSIKSGQVAQLSSPNSAIYLWALAAPDLADQVFCDGGINMEFIGNKALVGLDGTAGTMMHYNGGVGSNKIRFIIRHQAGVKHRIQAIFEYFKAP